MSVPQVPPARPPRPCVPLPQAALPRGLPPADAAWRRRSGPASGALSSVDRPRPAGLLKIVHFDFDANYILGAQWSWQAGGAGGKGFKRLDFFGGVGAWRACPQWRLTCLAGRHSKVSAGGSRARHYISR
jgi:hypothetical protein